MAFDRIIRTRAALILTVGLLTVSLQATPAMSQHPFPRRFKVAPFPESVAWINTGRDLQLDGLRGKFVLLDFWTYCCINCMHVLPELNKLERAYPDNLVVIGVHSAKFATEKDAQNVTDAVLRYKIEHPVMNDPKHILWERFRINSWPTLILIDPQGEAVWGKSGETTFEQVDAVLKKALPYYRRRDLLDETPLNLDREADRAAETPLWFPGKVLADEQGGRLFIADSNHNRIVVARLDGTLLQTIGSGTAGRTDGDYSAAQFKNPQGMALGDEMLYVADTDNHLIRKIDLRGRRVSTVAGTGTQRRGILGLALGVSPLQTALASPWALWLEGDSLYVAMAGLHQIWRLALSRSRIGPYAGNGREDIVDGPLLPDEPYQTGFASFAQPSGLGSDGTWLYVADSEGSSIRAVPLNPRKAVPLDPRKHVKTVVGTADLPRARLFTFGDVDGVRSRAQLQHALGVVYYRHKLYVADTYNNKIKVVDPATGLTRTVAGTGRPGDSDTPAAFDEPAGISAAGDKLFVADTNNHLIRVVYLREGDLRRGNRVSTLQIAGLDMLESPQTE